MNPYLSLVDAFHKAFRYMQPTPVVPTITDRETNNLREDLIREELHELENALSKGDAVEVLDALCDLQYVVSGAVLALGFGNVFDAAFAEVHRSNLSKTWTKAEVASESRRVLCQLSFDPAGDCYIARRADSKIIKSPSYSPAQLRQFVE